MMDFRRLQSLGDFMRKTRTIKKEKNVEFFWPKRWFEIRETDCIFALGFNRDILKLKKNSFWIYYPLYLCGERERKKCCWQEACFFED